MKKLRIALACILGLVVLLLAASPWLPGALLAPGYEHVVCTEDYPQLYAAQMQDVFGDYRLGPRMEGHINGEACSCGYSHDEIDYYWWEITYRDSTGAEMRCVLNNHESFYAQQYEWMEQQIEVHFFDEYIRPGVTDMREQGSYCFCRVGNIINGTSGSEQMQNMDTAAAWRRTQVSNETIVPLHALEYDRVFLDYPVILSIHVWLDDARLPAGEWQANFDAKRLQMEDAIGAIQTDTGGNVHMSVSLYSDSEAVPHPGKKLNWHYLAGEAVSPCTATDLQHLAFDWYRGRFW